MAKLKKYYLVEKGDVRGLINYTNVLMKHGWQPIGGAFSRSWINQNRDKVTSFYQAMVNTNLNWADNLK